VSQWRRAPGGARELFAKGPKRLSKEARARPRRRNCSSRFGSSRWMEGLKSHTALMPVNCESCVDQRPTRNPTIAVSASSWGYPDPRVYTSSCCLNPPWGIMAGIDALVFGIPTRGSRRYGSIWPRRSRSAVTVSETSWVAWLRAISRATHPVPGDHAERFPA